MQDSVSNRSCGRCGAVLGPPATCPRCGVPSAQAPPPPPADLVRHRRQRRRLLSRLLLGGALVAVAGLVSWWILSGSAPSSVAGEAQAREAGTGQQPLPRPPSPAGQTAEPTTEAEPGTEAGHTEQEPADGQDARQAEAIESLLSGSHASRSNLGDAIAAASSCERAGVRRIAEITAGRRDQLAQAKRLEVGSLPDGEAVKSALVEALDASHRADAAFHAWARRYQAGGCAGKVSRDRDYRRGLAHSESAQTAKERFADAWRPLARTYDLTAWAADEI
ncbi:hypothetical protein [Nonomuraea soli]|uniref:rRNA maturation protein Nop10 n=1 Tax=Nonomuraea soli TaxID=1032476 RepID=A0A7W0CP36_9ACTN|nr:hypothetical protein [Nonomuraea soli]MBA2894632.1 rRNA maturation protein Nop10 [Nonomuraea soli]